MSLNERIAKVIEYSGFTASEFADEIDVQRSSVSHITSGRNKPSLEFIIKIKSRFPEILWDWLVTGEGEMLKSELPHESKEIENIEEKTKPTSIPDLFTMMNTDEDFGIEEAKEETKKNNSPESYITKPNIEKQKISDSQPLEHLNNFALNPSSENQNHKIKRIVFFYENGTFESFEP